MDLLFKKLDKFSIGYLEISDVKNGFYPRFHPDVKSGKRNEEEILGEFLDTMEMHHQLFNKFPNSRVSKDEFIEYLRCISSTIEDDSNFEQYIVNAWKMTSGFKEDEKEDLSFNKSYKGYNINKIAPFGTSDVPVDYSTSLRQKNQIPIIGNEKSVPAGFPSWPKTETRLNPPYLKNFQNAPQLANQYNKLSMSDTSSSIIEKIRKLLQQRGVRGITSFWMLLLNPGFSNSGIVDLSSLKQVVMQLKLKLNDDDIESLFRLFATDINKRINSYDIIQKIVGEMNSIRKNISIQAFKSIDVQSKGLVTLEVLKSKFRAAKHPDVMLGKKNEE